MLTIGRLAKLFGLSRSTLLYYERVGLLSPTDLTGKGYRLYDTAQRRRLQQVCALRAAGLSAADIKGLLDRPARSTTAAVLRRRLEEINSEMRTLREQQRLLARLLARKGKLPAAEVMDRQTWTELLAAAGFSEADMHRWHVDFERLAPDKHRRFLEFLNIPPAEIAIIRGWAQEKRSA